MIRIPDTIKHLFFTALIILLVPMVLKIDVSNFTALYFPLNERFGFWQYITYIFMHAGPTHLLFNFIAIWFFGYIFVDMWGPKKFLFFFFSAGIGAGLIYTGINYLQFYPIYDSLLDAGLTKAEIIATLESGYSSDQRVVQNITQEDFNKIGGLFTTPMVGASGAAYGIMTAYAVFFPNRKIYLLFPPIPLVTKYYVITLIAADVFLGVLNRVEDNVARFAHVGGAIVGFIIATYWKKNQFNRMN